MVVVQNSLLSQTWLDHAEVVHVLECDPLLSDQGPVVSKAFSLNGG